VSIKLTVGLGSLGVVIVPSLLSALISILLRRK
jgi:hypothetical protein